MRSTYYAATLKPGNAAARSREQRAQYQNIISDAARINVRASSSPRHQACETHRRQRKIAKELCSTARKIMARPRRGIESWRDAPDGAGYDAPPSRQRGRRTNINGNIMAGRNQHERSKEINMNEMSKRRRKKACIEEVKKERHEKYQSR